MKNRPLKHKSQNAFKFKSSHERNAGVDVRKLVFYDAKPEYEKADGTQFHFYEAILKWSALNSSREYQQFQGPLRSIVTLPDLLHKKEFVFDHLLQSLNNATTLSLQALLEFPIALAKDLRSEFCPFFLIIFDELIKLLDTNDPDRVEWTQVCIAQLLKTQKSFVKNKLDVFFSRIVDLLDEAKPLYITNFAAECFGFIAKSTENKIALILMITDAVKKKPSITVGCGRLLFEIMRGVDQQLHSCAEEFWRMLFTELMNDPNTESDFDPKIMFDILVQTVTDMTECIRSAHLDPFWNPIHLAIDQMLENPNRAGSCSCNYVLQLLGIVVEHQHGKLLNNPSRLVGQLVKIINTSHSEEVLQSVTKIAAVMMLSRNLKLSQIEGSRLSKNIVAIRDRSRRAFESFVISVTDYSMFDNLILPDYLKFFKNNFDLDSLQVLSQIVTKKSALCGNGINLSNWKQFPIKLDCSKTKENFMNLLQGELNKEHSPEYLMCMILLPHIVDFEDNQEIVTAVVQEVYSLSSRLDNQHNFIPFSLIIECLVHIKVKKKDIFIRAVEKLLPVISSARNEYLLNVIDMCLTKIHLGKSQLLSEQLFDAVHLHLNEFLGSVNHQTRLLVTHSFSLFGHLEKLRIKNEDETLFDILYAIETIEPTVHNYRDQIMLLQKLEYDTDFFQNMSSERRLDAMKYVLSILSMNFLKLWKPACDVLQTYADNFAISDFWSIYKQQLDLTTSNMNMQLGSSEATAIAACNFLQAIETKIKALHDNRHPLGYRERLLNAWSNFSRMLEARSADIVRSFFHFIETEYQTQMNTEMNEKSPKVTLQILIAYLKIFANIKNPKTIYRSGELYDFYMELVTHRCNDVHKLALDCIFTYNNASLVPYKANLYRLISDKNIKEEIQNFFKVEGEKKNELRCVIQDEHRAEVVQLVIRIVHTKMVLKTTPEELKPLLLRFIGNFREDEIKTFISKSFNYFERLLKSNPLETYRHVVEDGLNIENIPTHRFKALMKLIDNIRDQFAGLKEKSFIQHLLHLKLCMDSTLLQMDHSVVKELKSQALLNLVEFFKHFADYNWRREEMEAVFFIYVWPQIGKLESDCIHSPTPLLKLFIAWSKDPKYHPLLAKVPPTTLTMVHLTPLESVTNLLIGEKTSPKVSQEIVKMIICMFTMEDTNGIDSSLLEEIQSVDKADIEKSDLNVGSYLLLPHVANILLYIHRVLMRQRSISNDHLLILSRVAEYAKEPTQCDSLLELLVPMTVKKTTLHHVEPDTIRQMNATIESLIKSVWNPEKYLRQMGLLLESVKDTATRKIICQIIGLIANKSNKVVLIKCATIINNMNMLHKRGLDRPDYECQMGAFRDIDGLLDGNEIIEIDSTLLFVHQCFYYLKTEKDLAMRNNANHYLRKIIVTSLNKHGTDRNADIQYLIERIILPALMKGIKDNNDSTRTESIQLLGDLCRDCAEHNTVFSDLHPFTCSQDRELDFFDNITHIQPHRHRRSMNRFCKTAQKLTHVPSSRALVNFLLPIVSSYLGCEKYRKKSKMTEAAGNCVAVIARMLPWSGYKELLKQFLNRMKQSIEYRKQTKSIVVSLLDNFHFDLSNADMANFQEMGECAESENMEVADDDDSATIDTTVVDPVEIPNHEAENDECLPTLTTTPKQVKISFQNKTLLTKENAEIVLDDILRNLLPSLFSTFKYQESQDSIKLHERKERYQREKEEMIKIPIAIAIVKLLQKLPKRYMDSNLPKLLFKVIIFLKSNLKQVRSVARETLQSILLSLGPSFLKETLKHLKDILTRGFQRHVLMVTVYTILDALKDQLKTDTVDDILQIVLNMCINDIFGFMAEEKEVASVTSKTPEAKPSAKSYLILQILASNMSEKSTLDIIMPFKEIVSKTQSRKTVSKVQEALNKISSGICANQNINTESMLILVFGITSSSSLDLASGSKSTTQPEKQKDKIKPKSYDNLLIPAEPKRMGANNLVSSVVGRKSNSYVFLEMGLEILLTLLRKNEVSLSEYISFLEPLTPIIIESMNSNHTKVTVLGIKCISSVWSSRLELPSVETNIEKIVESLLKVLHQYATAVIGCNDENFQLIKSSFKAVVTLLKYVKYFKISDDQLKVLLLYVEQDLQHHEKQNMALLLLKSIIGRKLNTNEIASIVKNVAELSITSEYTKIRDDSRQIVLDYLLNYPLGNNVDHTIEFYISQLEYTVLAGRESAVTMLRMVFKSFPADVISRKSSFLFLTVGIRLINEESSECRALVAECLESLLDRLNKQTLNELFELVLAMLQDSRLNHRELAAQLFTRMLNVEKQSFSSRLDKLLPALLCALNDSDSENIGKFVKIQRMTTTDEESTKTRRAHDHSLIQLLNTFQKVFEMCPETLTSAKFYGIMDEFSYSLQHLLTHDHHWVRFGALKLLSLILENIDVEKISQIMSGKQHGDTPQFIYSNHNAEVKSLVLDMCTQLVPAETDDDTASLITQNLLFAANMLRAIPLESSNDKNINSETKKQIDLIWLMRRVRYVIQSEVSIAPKSFVLRKHMFHWMSALVALLDEQMLLILAPSVLSPVMRELSNDSQLDESLKQSLLSLTNQIKDSIGAKRYDEIYLTIQAKTHEKRISRQREVVLQKINNPKEAFKRKMAVKNRKKEAKKRRTEIDNKVGRGRVQTHSRKRKRLENLFEDK